MYQTFNASLNVILKILAGTILILHTGCTIDLSAQETLKNGRMKLLLPPKGQLNGGIQVDTNFETLLSKKFRSDTMEDLRLNHKHHYMKLLRDFEIQKRRQKLDVRINKDIRVRLPSFLITRYKQLNDISEEDYKAEADNHNVEQNDPGDHGKVRINKKITAEKENGKSESDLENCKEKTLEMDLRKSQVSYGKITEDSQEGGNNYHGNSGRFQESEFIQAQDIDPKYAYVDVYHEEFVVAKEKSHELYDDTVQCVMDELNKVLQSKNCKTLQTIILVGGLSESDYVRKAIEAKFKPQCKIYKPLKSDLAVLRGAVLFGLNPEIIESRVSRYTYGIAVFEDFDPSRHDKHKHVTRNGKDQCKDCFSKKFTINEHVPVGSVTEFKVYDTFGNRLHKKEDPISVPIYVSDQENPKYTDDHGCRKLCSLFIEPENGMWPMTVKGIVTFEVSKTELVAQFRDENTQRTAKCKFDFM